MRGVGTGLWEEPVGGSGVCILPVCTMAADEGQGQGSRRVGNAGISIFDDLSPLPSRASSPAHGGAYEGQPNDSSIANGASDGEGGAGAWGEGGAFSASEGVRAKSRGHGVDDDGGGDEPAAPGRPGQAAHRSGNGTHDPTARMGRDALTGETKVVRRGKGETEPVRRGVTGAREKGDTEEHRGKLKNEWLVRELLIPSLCRLLQD